ncbi:MAG: hypothetical protein EON59_14475 [Alphaproteobacteria bacterium]|nr:MAG: hypothetical protein EON59_14475 [Alphaproteobacteria bacterium]
MNFKIALASVAAFALMGFGTAKPVAAVDCPSAASSYDLASSGVSSRLRRYSSCVTYSAGNDDCYSEFRRLKSAQADFELAVMGYKTACQ